LTCSLRIGQVSRLEEEERLVMGRHSMFLSKEEGVATGPLFLKIEGMETLRHKKFNAGKLNFIPIFIILIIVLLINYIYD
jgi:hypothetical protein